MAEVRMSARRAPRSRGIGDARHRSYLTSAEHGNPVAVRWRRPATDRPTMREAEVRGGNGTAKKQMAAHRKVTGKRRQMTGPSNRSFSYNWPHTRPSCLGPKGS
jgi:hypothetical protein